MKALKKLMDRLRPRFEKGGGLHALKSVYDGMDTFLSHRRRLRSRVCTFMII